MVDDLFSLLPRSGGSPVDEQDEMNFCLTLVLPGHGNANI